MLRARVARLVGRAGHSSRGTRAAPVAAPSGGGALGAHLVSSAGAPQARARPCPCCWARHLSAGAGGRAGERDPYALLAVGRDASASEIKAAFRKRALKLHPDVRRARTPEEAEEHREEFVDLLWAVSVLGDHQRRAAYDRSALPSASSPFADSDYVHPQQQQRASRRTRRNAGVWDEEAQGGRGWSYTAASGRRTSGDADPLNRGSRFGGREGGGAHRERGQGDAEQEGAEVPGWLLRYEQLVSQGALQYLMDPVRVLFMFPPAPPRLRCTLHEACWPETIIELVGSGGGGGEGGTGHSVLRAGILRQPLAAA